jgi:hypothetical protein
VACYHLSGDPARVRGAKCNGASNVRLVGDVSKTAAAGMIADKAPPPADAQKAAKKVASRSGGRRETVTKVHKKRVRAKRPRH